MADLSVLLVFAGALLVLELTPGQDMLLILGRGIGQGRRVAFMTIIGVIFVAGFVQVGLLVLGVASVLAAFPVALQVLQWVGGAYLLFLGGRLIVATIRRHGQHQATLEPLSDKAAIRQGALSNLTNPKSLLFMFAFIPQFVDPTAGPVWIQLFVLGSIQKLAGVVSLGLVALAAGAIGSWLYRRPRLVAWQQRFAGAVMLLLGLRLLFGGQPATSSK